MKTEYTLHMHQIIQAFQSHQILNNEYIEDISIITSPFIWAFGKQEPKMFSEIWACDHDIVMPDNCTTSKDIEKYIELMDIVYCMALQRHFCDLVTAQEFNDNLESVVLDCTLTTYAELKAVLFRHLSGIEVKYLSFKELQELIAHYGQTATNISTQVCFAQMTTNPNQECGILTFGGEIIRFAKTLSNSNIK